MGVGGEGREEAKKRNTNTNAGQKNALVRAMAYGEWKSKAEKSARALSNAHR